jgi:RNA polymerase sigma factor (sigma-70 family)
MGQPPDKEILAFYAAGAEALALRALTREYRDPIRAHVAQGLRRFRDLPGLGVDDVAHEALMRVHQALNRHVEPQSIRALDGWIWRATRFEVTDQIRRAIRTGREVPMGLVVGDMQIDASDPSADALERERQALFERCLDALGSGRARASLELRLVGHPLRVVAERLGLASAMAASRLIEKAADALRKCVAAQHRGPGPGR